MLSVPNLPSIYAVFEKLEIKGEPKPNVLEYSFVFREVMEKKQKTVITYFDCENGQTLWDIAYKTGVKIDELVRLNPDVKFPDENLGTRRLSCADLLFTDKNGKRCEIKNVLTAEISADVDVPADELVMTVPYDEKFEMPICLRLMTASRLCLWDRLTRLSAL